jgi:hypothetical protein
MKKGLLITAACLGLAQTIFAEEASKLALPERRAVKEYQEKILPDLKKQLDAAAGFEVPVETMWDTIALPGASENYSSPDYWTNIYFVPIIGALKAVAVDEDGKKALKEHLKKIVIQLVPDKAPASNYAEGLTFKEGILTINWTPFSNAADVAERTKAIQTVLEAAL